MVFYPAFDSHKKLSAEQARMFQNILTEKSYEVNSVYSVCILHVLLMKSFIDDFLWTEQHLWNCISPIQRCKLQWCSRPAIQLQYCYRNIEKLDDRKTLGWKFKVTLFQLSGILSQAIKMNVSFSKIAMARHVYVLSVVKLQLCLILLMNY